MSFSRDKQVALECAHGLYQQVWLNLVMSRRIYTVVYAQKKKKVDLTENNWLINFFGVR